MERHPLFSSGSPCRTRSERGHTFPAVFQSAMAYDWPQFNGNAQHDGNNTREEAIHPRNVGRLSEVFSVSLPAEADGAPVYLGGISTPIGVRNMLYLTTVAGHLVALDARTGERIWVVQPFANGCGINNGSRPCYSTSSPRSIRTVASYTAMARRLRAQIPCRGRGRGFARSAGRRSQR